MPYRLWLERPDLTWAMDLWKEKWSHHQVSLVCRQPIHSKSLFQLKSQSDEPTIIKSHTYTSTQIHRHKPSCISHANPPDRPDRCNSMKISLGSARYNIVMLWSGANCRFDKSRQCCLPATRSRAAQQPKAVTSGEGFAPIAHPPSADLARRAFKYSKSRKIGIGGPRQRYIPSFRSPRPMGRRVIDPSHAVVVGRRNCDAGPGQRKYEDHSLVALQASSNGVRYCTWGCGRRFGHSESCRCSRPTGSAPTAGSPARWQLCFKRLQLSFKKCYCTLPIGCQVDWDKRMERAAVLGLSNRMTL